MNNKQKNLTEGNLSKQILFFTLPLMIAFFIQLIYNSADLVFAGNFLGKEATAAMGISLMMINCLIGLFAGISIGGGIVYAQAIGAGKGEVVHHVFEASIWISIIAGGVLSCLGYAATPFLLRLLKTPEAILFTATAYARVYFFCLLPMILYIMISGMIRAAGNSKAPMIAQLWAGIVNICLDYLFLGILDFGIRSLAVAAILSQTTAAVVILVLYFKSVRNTDNSIIGEKGNNNTSKNTINSFFAWFVPSKKTWTCLKNITLLGLPVGLQNTAMTFANIFVQYKINQLGIASIAAFSNYCKIELFIYYPLLAFGQANLYFVSQNFGAKKMDRVNRSIKTSIIIGLIVVIPLEIIFLYFGETIFAIFNPDPEVIAEGLKIIKLTFPLYWLYLFIEVLSYAVRGIGKTAQAMMIMLFSFCLMRVVLLIVIPNVVATDIVSIMVVYPTTWVISFACFAIYWYKLRRTVLKDGKLV